MTIKDPLQQITRLEFNQRQQRTAVLDAKSQRYEFDYTNLGQVKNIRRGGGELSFTYDPAGNRETRTDYNGAVTTVHLIMGETAD